MQPRSKLQRAGGGGAEEDLAAIERAGNLVRDGVAAELDVHQTLFGAFGGLFNRLGNFVGAAVADADVAGAITDDAQGGEAEATATLNHLGAAIDEDDLLEHRGTIGLGTAITIVATAVVIAEIAQGGDQKLRPRARAASAKTLTLPW